MKTKDEIEHRLQEAQAQLEHLSEWYEKAYQQYQDDRRWWGKDADRGEMDYVSDLQSQLHAEINLFKWILSNENENN